VYYHFLSLFQQYLIRRVAATKPIVNFELDFRKPTGGNEIPSRGHIIVQTIQEKTRFYSDNDLADLRKHLQGIVLVQAGENLFQTSFRYGRRSGPVANFAPGDVQSLAPGQALSTLIKNIARMTASEPPAAVKYGGYSPKQVEEDSDSDGASSDDEDDEDLRGSTDSHRLRNGMANLSPADASTRPTYSQVKSNPKAPLVRTNESISEATIGAPSGDPLGARPRDQEGGVGLREGNLDTLRLDRELRLFPGEVQGAGGSVIVVGEDDS
jgi:hypothetical protein